MMAVCGLTTGMHQGKCAVISLDHRADIAITKKHPNAAADLPEDFEFDFDLVPQFDMRDAEAHHFRDLFGPGNDILEADDADGFLKIGRRQCAEALDEIECGDFER